MALHGFVSTVVEAFTHGYTREQLSLEIAVMFSVQKRKRVVTI